ncbi:cytochrome c oxidase subunit 6A1, mitochondrial [Andrena cerasifolii]|uniref:cytochrome c oxidase subunit 6A1, mitochondrial n=1 Tax=Andrena cerasifolii TaxID=2819439 RepID=UPI004038317C
MLSVRRLGQFGHTFKRGMETVVQTVEQRCQHGNVPATLKMWKAITAFVAVPSITLSLINCVIRHNEEHDAERPEFVAYQYMKIITKPYPWGDGKHTLFHNPKRNYIPGLGYEA